MKKLFCLLLALCLPAAAAGCRAAPAGGAVEVPAAPPLSPEAPTDASPEAPPAGEQAGASLSAEALAAYRFALEQIAFEHVYPDGSDTGFESAGGFIEDNHFALWDITGDGREELLVQFVTAPMAGNTESVYTFDEETRELRRILSVFPATTYYSSGIIKEEWSHGSGLAGEEYWPYNLYRYDEERGSCALLAEVNMWSRCVDTVDYKGDPYPEDIDREQAGTVFILTRSGVTETVSKGEYEAWLADLTGGGAAVEIPYQPLSEKAIRALSPAAAAP